MRGTIVSVILVVIAWCVAVAVGVYAVRTALASPDEILMAVVVTLGVAGIATFLTWQMLHRRRLWFDVAAKKTLDSMWRRVPEDDVSAQAMVDVFETADPKRFPTLVHSGDFRVGLHTQGSAELIVTIWRPDGDGVLAWPPIMVDREGASKYAWVQSRTEGSA